MEEAKLRVDVEERQAKRQAEEEERHARLKSEEDERRMEILNLQANLPPAGQGAVSDAGRALRPKRSKIDEEKDDIDALLQRFERFATIQRWPYATWSTSVSTLLTGKGLDVYASLRSIKQMTTTC